MQEASGRQDEAQMDTGETELISHLEARDERGWLMHVIERSDEWIAIPNNEHWKATKDK